LTLSNEEIADMINKFDNDSKALKKDLLSMTWFMRGGISYDDAYMLSPDERSMIHDIIKQNLETTKESGLPFF